MCRRALWGGFQSKFIVLVRVLEILKTWPVSFTLFINQVHFPHVSKELTNELSTDPIKFHRIKDITALGA